jgi:hypothetical protein
MGFLQSIVSNQSSYSIWKQDDEHTRLRTLILNTSISVPIHLLIPGLTVAAKEACNAFRVDILAIYTESSLLPSGGTLLLFANHQVDFFSLDVLADMPCGKTVFVLFFSASEVGNVRALWLLMEIGWARRICNIRNKVKEIAPCHLGIISNPKHLIV